MSLLAYSIVIATLERPDELRVTLESLTLQRHSASRVIIVDASPSERSRVVAESFSNRLPLDYERAVEPSAAKQRNQGAVSVSTQLIAFLDDDVRLPADCFEKLCTPFSDDPQEEVGGVAGRIEGVQHTAPRGLLWWYYRLQAGYADPTYGGRLFGAGINCLPTYTEGAGDLIEAEWLPSGCVVFRTPLFQRELFPRFTGYSFMEDVHLSARIGRTHRLYCHRSAWYEHFPCESLAKRNRFALSRSRLANQKRIAQEIIGLRGPRLLWRTAFHRAFVSLFLVRFRPTGWRRELAGTWL